MQTFPKSKFSYSIAIATLLCLFCNGITSQNQTSDAELEALLQKYAVDSTITDTVSPNSTVAINSPNEQNATKTNTNNASEKRTTPTVDELLANIDSAEIAKRAIAIAEANPIFMDMIFEYPREAKSLSLSGNDSIIQDIRTNAKNNIAQNNTELYQEHKDNLPEIDEILNADASNVDKESLKIDVDKKINEPTKIETPKKSFWTHGGTFSAQVSQNYVSDNWYKGGESNLAGILDAKAFINYNNEDNIQWDNKAELRLGINSATGDSLRKFRINEDLLKITTKLGIKAFGSFFYTIEGEFSTQLCNNYIPSTNERMTAPFAPIRTFLSVGLDYKYKDMLSIFISPASYKLVHVWDTTVMDDVDPANHIANKLGIEVGKKTLNQMGGLLKVSFKHNFINSIDLESDLSIYANYVGTKKGVEIDWRISANFLINRFFSAKIMLNPRYDTTIILPNGETPKIQFNEIISLGFNYKL